MRKGYPLPSRLEGLGERRKLPEWGPGQSPGEKRFYCFLSVSERLSLLRLLKINVVHSRPLVETRSSAEGPRDASCQLKSCQLPRNSAETTCTTSPEQMEDMKLEGYGGPMCNKHVHSTMTRSSRSYRPLGVINKPTTDQVVDITCIPTTCCSEIF